MVRRPQYGYGHIARNDDRDTRCSRGYFNLGWELVIPVIDVINDFLTSDVDQYRLPPGFSSDRFAIAKTVAVRDRFFAVDLHAVFPVAAAGLPAVAGDRHFRDWVGCHIFWGESSAVGIECAAKILSSLGGGAYFKKV